MRVFSGIHGHSMKRLVGITDVVDEETQVEAVGKVPGDCTGAGTLRTLGSI